MIVICEQCGEEFDKRLCYIRRSKRNFCTSECGYTWRREHEGNFAECDYCGVTFKRIPSEAGKYKNNFCSTPCASAFQVTGVEVTCDYCGINFTKLPSALKRTEHNFCSTECRRKYQVGKTFPGLRRRSVVTCKYCGDQFEKNDCCIARVGSHYCSRECFAKGTARGNTLACQNCGKDFYRVQSLIDKSLGGFFCSHKCFSEWNSGENHYLWLGDDTLYSREFNNTLKLEVRTRDSFACRECGYTEKQLGYTLHVHHINYDKSDSALDNLLSLCRSCHMQTNFSRDDWSRYFQDKLNGLVVDNQTLLPFMGVKVNGY